MNVKSKGRGTAAVFGLLLVFAGVIGAAVLFVLSQNRPDQAVDDFARAPIGCTTTLEFSETGTFFVFEESGGEIVPPEGGCVPVADPLTTYAGQLVLETHPDRTEHEQIKRYVAYGASPRGLQALIRGARVHAVLNGRTAVAVEDIQRVAQVSLRHRLILNFEGEAESLDIDTLIDELIKSVPTPAREAA